MSLLSLKNKSDIPAGIIGLRWAEANISPHHFLIEKEREYVRDTVRKSFKGVVELTEKAKQALSAFEQLQAIVQEGKDYFIPPGVYSSEPVNGQFALRQAGYLSGCSMGFQKAFRTWSKKIDQLGPIEGYSYTKEELRGVLDKASSIEQRRLAATHSFSRLLEESLQAMTKDEATLHAVCLLGHVEDVERFVRDRREDVKESRKSLFEWSNSTGDAFKVFCAEFLVEGWLRKVAHLGVQLKGTTDADFLPADPIGNLIPDARKRALSSAVVKILDEVAVQSRFYTSIPESPGKDLLRMEFLLTELEKSLPVAIQEEHRRQLAVVTDRFLNHPQHLVYVVAVAEDKGLTDCEKDRILRHVELEKNERVKAAEVAQARDVGSCPHQSRTAIRREIREIQAIERAQREFDEQHNGLRAAGEEATQQRAPEVKTVRYFPPRLGSELHEWSAALPEAVRESVYSLIHRCASGDRVDFKPIRIETKMFELRLPGWGYRIYCTRSKQGEVVVLGFGPKETQRADISSAHGRYRQLVASNEAV